jgi:branched-chain amino acid transport system ATP-binding protein
MASIEKRYNGVQALAGVSLNVAPGQIISLIGPNGAGKTTLFDVISGLEKPNAGSVRLDGENISALSPVAIAKKGVARSFQTCQVFCNLTVIENVLLGRYLKTKVSFWMAGIRSPSVYREEHRNLALAFEALDFFDLYDKADRKMAQISSFSKRLVEIARCLAMSPRLLLLDEPFGGLSETEIAWLAKKLITLRHQGMTLILIDHHFNSISTLSDEIAVLHQGRIIAKAKPDEIRRNPEVMRAYWGG